MKADKCGEMIRNLEDEKIIELYWARHESAIDETDKKYRTFCMYISRNILNDISDAEECINDTWLAAWNTIPPERPVHLSAFLGKIVKNLSLKKFRYNNSGKRRKEVTVSIEEISESAVSISDTESITDSEELAHIISEFLRGQSKEKRVMFLRRYWFFDSYSQISELVGVSEESVRVSLMRMRKKLKKYLEERGITA